VFFGRHAGLAGMIDSLWALGQRLAQGEGIETPLASLRQSFGYSSLQQARQAVRSAGHQLLEHGLPRELGPLVVGFAGYGNVSQGAQEIYDLLQPIGLSPEELQQTELDPSRCYKVVFKEQHLVEPLQGSFALQHYYDHPEAYRPVFAERYLDRLTVLVNCIFWEPRYPRLVTLEQLDALYDGPRPRLRVIGDISCDIHGSVEATVKATEPDAPVFVYDLQRGEAVDGVMGQGPVIMAVDNLPAELPRDASEWFSCSLMPLVPSLAAANFEAPSLEQTGLAPELSRAVIVYRGELAPGFEYLEEHLARHA
jgi:alpha-aminoadipic semialdehyde synthase